MRPIKFRAWDTLYIEMIYDVQHKREDRTFDNFLDSRYALMQFTGLHDKNGKEIYEGDILESVSEMVRLSTNEKTGKTHRKVCSVVYVPERAQFATQLSTGHIESGFGMSQEIIGKWYEVIGNIYEDEELLSGT